MSRSNLVDSRSRIEVKYSPPRTESLAKPKIPERYQSKYMGADDDIGYPPATERGGGEEKDNLQFTLVGHQMSTIDQRDPEKPTFLKNLPNLSFDKEKTNF